MPVIGFDAFGSFYSLKPCMDLRIESLGDFWLSNVCIFALYVDILVCSSVV